MISLVLALTVALVPDVGWAPEVFALGRTGGLQAALEARGHRVLRVALPDAPTLEAAAAGLVPALAEADWVIGHGYGGTAAALAAAHQPRVRGWIGLGAPLSFGGETCAARQVFAWSAGPVAGARTWLAVGDMLLGGQPLARLLMTRGLPPDVRRTVLGVAQRPLSVALLADVARRGAGRVTPDRRAAPLVALRGRPDLRVWALLAVADGWAPAWLADPVDLGVPGARRYTLTRANDHPGELGHLDLLVHPRAADEVFGRLIAVIEEDAP